jgi:hypothetical protein
MGTITLEGGEPFDLRLQLPVEVIAQDETLTLTFPVFAAGLPQSIGRIQLPLSLGDGVVLADQIQSAVRLAQQRKREL